MASVSISKEQFLMGASVSNSRERVLVLVVSGEQDER